MTESSPPHLLESEHQSLSLPFESLGEKRIAVANLCNRLYLSAFGSIQERHRFTNELANWKTECIPKNVVDNDIYCICLLAGDK